MSSPFWTSIASPYSGTLQMLLFNLQRPMFQDQRFRQAISLMFDHEWYMDFFGRSYDLPEGFYAGTRLAAESEIGPLEARMLQPFAEQLPDGTMSAPGPEDDQRSLSPRIRVQMADALLTEAGYHVTNGRRINPNTGAPVSLSVVTANADIARLLLPFSESLERIGIELAISIQDPAATQQLLFESEFDLTPIPWRPADPPGRIESVIWYSGFLEDQGFGVSGLQSDVANALIETMQSSTDASEITAATRAFDRYMRWSGYALPMWHEGDVWFVHRAGLGFPQDINPHRRPDEYWWWTD